MKASPSSAIARCYNQYDILRHTQKTKCHKKDECEIQSSPLHSIYSPLLKQPIVYLTLASTTDLQAVDSLDLSTIS